MLAAAAIAFALLCLLIGCLLILIVEGVRQGRAERRRRHAPATLEGGSSHLRSYGGSA